MYSSFLVVVFTSHTDLKQERNYAGIDNCFVAISPHLADPADESNPLEQSRGGRFRVFFRVFKSF